MFVLDTDVLSELARKRPSAKLLEALRRHPPAAFHTTVVSVVELRYGAMRRDDVDSFWNRLVTEVLGRVRVVKLDGATAVRAGELLAQLERRGEPIGLADVLIAAITLERGATLITGNTAHFTRVAGLRVENWIR